MAEPEYRVEGSSTAAARAPPEELPAVAGLRGLVSDSRSVAAGTLLSRSTGFIRIVTIAGVLGPTYFANIFQTVVLLPNALFALLGGSLTGAILVPRLVFLIDARERGSLERFANDIFGMTIAVLTLIALASFAAGPLILMGATAAVHDHAIRRQEETIGLQLLAMLLPQLVLYGAAAVGMAVQHAHGRFALPAAAPASENLTAVAVFWLAALLFGSGWELGAIALPRILLIGLGTTLAVGVHAAVQWYGAYRTGIALVPMLRWPDAEVRRVLRLAFTSSGYTALYNLVFFAAIIVSGRVAGGVVAFQTGFNFTYLPVALGAIPLAFAQLPRLSRSFNEGDAASFTATVQRSLGLGRFIAVPAGLLLLTTAGLLAPAIAFGQMNSAAGKSMLAACIGGLGLGVLGEAMIVIVTSALYARHDATTPLRAMVMRTVIALAGMGVAFAFADGTTLLLIVTGSIAVASIVSAIYLHHGLSRQMKSSHGLPIRERLGDVASSVLAVLPAICVALWAPRFAADRYEGIALACIVIGGGIGIYLTAQWMRGSREFRLLLEGVRFPGAGRFLKGREAP